jgi:hypothetical protein
VRVVCVTYWFVRERGVHGRYSFVGEVGLCVRYWFVSRQVFVLSAGLCGERGCVSTGLWTRSFCVLGIGLCGERGVC